VPKIRIEGTILLDHKNDVVNALKIGLRLSGGDQALAAAKSHYKAQRQCR